MTQHSHALDAYQLYSERALAILEGFTEKRLFPFEGGLFERYEAIFGSNQRTDLRLFFTSHLAMLKMGRTYRRNASQQIATSVRTLARFGETFSNDPLEAAQQLIEAANNWPTTRLWVLRYAISYGDVQRVTQRFDWRIHQRALTASLRCFAPTARRSRRLAALMHACAGFFGQDKADERNNP